jgi:hypothetical protein
MARVWAAIGVAASLLGAAGLTLAGRDGPGLAGYVSEAGVAGAPHAVLYHGTLVVLVAATGAAALALRAPARLAALALGLAAPCLLVSSAARCTRGCPLPPFEPTTAGDLLHAGASIAAVGLCALAMLAAAWRALDQWVRRASRWAAGFTIPVLVTMAVGLLTVGHGVFTGVVERISLIGCLGWLVTVCTLGARPAP